MSLIRARLAESSTWARFGHSLFVLAWLPDVPRDVAIGLIGSSVVALLISACMPDPKP